MVKITKIIIKVRIFSSCLSSFFKTAIFPDIIFKIGEHYIVNIDFFCYDKRFRTFGNYYRIINIGILLH